MLALTSTAPTAYTIAPHMLTGMTKYCACTREKWNPSLIIIGRNVPKPRRTQLILVDCLLCLWVGSRPGLVTLLTVQDSHHRNLYDPVQPALHVLGSFLDILSAVVARPSCQVLAPCCISYPRVKSQPGNNPSMVLTTVSLHLLGPHLHQQLVVCIQEVRRLKVFRYKKNATSCPGDRNYAFDNVEPDRFRVSVLFLGLAVFSFL